MAKYDPQRRDPYIDPTTGVLRNRVGARNQHTLDLREAQLTALSALDLDLHPESGSFDLAHLQRIHYRLFADVYEWAGQLRTVDIVKGETRFAHHGALTSAGADLFGRLAREGHLRGLDAARFAERAGYYLGEVNVLHPFRDGNGRAQRAFFGQLARGAGYRIAWDGMTRDAVLRASVAAYHGEPTPMAALLRAHLNPRRR